MHKDDAQLGDLKDLLKSKGYTLRDASITSDKPNNAKNESYIKSNYLAPRINWAGTVAVLITPATKKSDWVNWEIEYAVRHDKRIVGIYARGAADSDTPEAFEKYGDALVGWNTDRIIDAIEGRISNFETPDGNPRKPRWNMNRIACQ